MQDCSYGTIPYRVVNGVIYFLLLIDARCKHWTYPKGHAEGTETFLETALRELQEETALVPSAILEHEPLIQEYSFKHNGNVINRRLEFVIVLIDDPVIVLQTDEVLHCRWMTYEEVLSDTPFPELHKNTHDALRIIKTQYL